MSIPSIVPRPTSELTPIGVKTLDTENVAVFVAFASIALWTTLTLTTRILTTFKRFSGLYFYSLLFTSWGIAIRQIGCITLFFAPNCPWIIKRMLVEVGWVAMVSGFSMVLYSRLSIICQSRKARRAVLGMVIGNAVLWHGSVIVLNAGIRWLKNRGMKDRLPAWNRIHDPIEKTQIVMFSVQETVISFFYVRAAYRYLRSRFAHPGKTRRVMFLLLLVQFIIIVFDVAIIVIDLAGYLQLKVFIHSFVYSGKLELEFVVLNQLVGFSRLGLPNVVSIDLSRQDRPVVENGDMAGRIAKSVTVERMLPKRRLTSDSSVDLESCASKGSRDTLEFVTVPDLMRIG